MPGKPKEKPVTIKIDTTAAFDRRLAELAWEYANDTVKTTVVNTLALAIAGNSDVLQSLSALVVDDLTERIAAVVEQNPQVVQATNKAEQFVCDKINEVKKDIADKLASPGYDVEKLRKTIVSNVVSAEMSKLHDRILGSCNLKDNAMRAVFNGVVEAAKSRVMLNPSSIDAELRQAITLSLDAIKKTRPTESF
jgi:uncharacterized protein (UPF0335 family)